MVTLLYYDGWKPILELSAAEQVVAKNTYGSGPDEILFRYRAADGLLLVTITIG